MLCMTIRDAAFLPYFTAGLQFTVATLRYPGPTQRRSCDTKRHCAHRHRAIQPSVTAHGGIKLGREAQAIESMPPNGLSRQDEQRRVSGSVS